MGARVAQHGVVRSMLRKKYWLTGPLVILASNLRRGKAGTIGIEITPA